MLGEDGYIRLPVANFQGGTIGAELVYRRWSEGGGVETYGRFRVCFQNGTDWLLEPATR